MHQHYDALLRCGNLCCSGHGPNQIELRLSDTTPVKNGQHAWLLKSKACDDLLLRGIIRGTAQGLQGTVHPRDATRFRISVESLESTCSAVFEGLKARAHVINGSWDGYNSRYGSASSHDTCNPSQRFRDFASKTRTKALSKIDEILQSDDYKGRMKKQREKIGLKSL